MRDCLIHHTSTLWTTRFLSCFFLGMLTVTTSATTTATSTTTASHLTLLQHHHIRINYYVYLLRSFESSPRQAKIDHGNVLRAGVPVHLREHYQWVHKVTQRAWVSDSSIDVGESLSISNSYPSVFSKPPYAPGHLLYMVGRFVFVFCTTGIKLTSNQSKDLVKSVAAVLPDDLLMYKDVLRIMQDPAKECADWWQVRALMYVEDWAEAKVAASKLCKDEPALVITGYKHSPNNPNNPNKFHRVLITAIHLIIG